MAPSHHPTFRVDDFASIPSTERDFNYITNFERTLDMRAEIELTYFTLFMSPLGYVVWVDRDGFSYNVHQYPKEIPIVMTNTTARSSAMAKIRRPFGVIRARISSAMSPLTAKITTRIAHQKMIDQKLYSLSIFFHLCVDDVAIRVGLDDYFIYLPAFKS